MMESRGMIVSKGKIIDVFASYLPDGDLDQSLICDLFSQTVDGATVIFKFSLLQELK